MSSVYGKCKSKNFGITKPWKCVDMRIHEKYQGKEREKIDKLIHEEDHFDICIYCRDFIPV